MRRNDSEETKTKKRHSWTKENEGGLPGLDSLALLKRSFRRERYETVSFLEESIVKRARCFLSYIRTSGYFVEVLDILSSMNLAIIPSPLPLRSLTQSLRI